MAKSITGITACVKVYEGEKDLVWYERNGIAYVDCPHFYHGQCSLADRKIPNPISGSAPIAEDHYSFVRIPRWCPLKGTRPKQKSARTCKRCSGHGAVVYSGRGRNRKEVSYDPYARNSYRQYGHRNCPDCGGTGIIAR